MFFFLRRKKIVVDCFTDHISAAKLFPIDYANKFYPNWWKKLPNSYDEEDANGVKYKSSTMKSCPGFTDLYKQGFIMPLWSELHVNTSANGHFAWNFSDMISYIGDHSKSQYMESEKQEPNFIHLKIISQWKLVEKTGVSFAFIEPFWNNRDTLGNYFVTPGVLNFKYNCATEINLLFPRKTAQIQIAAGAPLAHIIPISEYNIEIKTHLISKSELQFKFAKLQISRVSDYYKRKHIIDKKESEKKCPFGFGK